MRIAAGLLASATVLFVTGALAIVGTWALVTGVVLAVAAAVVAVVAMEEREQLATGTHIEAAYLGQLDLPG
jgi:ABC-type Fe2+-enterobactin transport system substrate-binding protein